jgi:hypothetical protein
VTGYKDQKVADLWQYFEDIRLHASIDAVGKYAEIVRSGTDWSTVEDNLAWARQLPNVELKIAPVISAINIWWIDSLLDYFDWVEKRNPERYNDNMGHGGNYDGKNLAHCHRLLDMAIEIGEGKGINIRRNNREELLSIRRGEHDYDKLVEEAELKIKRMDDVFESAGLPKSIDRDFLNDLLIKIRKEYYGRK